MDSGQCLCVVVTGEYVFGIWERKTGTKTRTGAVVIVGVESIQRNLQNSWKTTASLLLRDLLYSSLSQHSHAAHLRLPNVHHQIAYPHHLLRTSRQ